MRPSTIASGVQRGCNGEAAGPAVEGCHRPRVRASSGASKPRPDNAKPHLAHSASALRLSPHGDGRQFPVVSHGAHTVPQCASLVIKYQASGARPQLCSGPSELHRKVMYEAHFIPQVNLARALDEKSPCAMALVSKNCAVWHDGWPETICSPLNGQVLRSEPKVPSCQRPLLEDRGGGSLLSTSVLLRSKYNQSPSRGCRICMRKMHINGFSSRSFLSATIDGISGRTGWGTFLFKVKSICQSGTPGADAKIPAKSPLRNRASKEPSTRGSEIHRRGRIRGGDSSLPAGQKFDPTPAGPLARYANTGHLW